MPPHPLDTDLIDYIDGVLDGPAAAAVEAHLAGCLLCRIQRQRLTAEPPVAPIDVRGLRVPDFERLDIVELPGSDARPGDLWLTRGAIGQLVLIRKVRDNGWGVIVSPATLDINVADTGTFLVSADTSPLNVSFVIYENLHVSLPHDALRERVRPARDIDLLAIDDSTPGITRGSALTGPEDVRHEVRQYLVDQLTALDTPEPGDDGDPGDAFDAFRDRLQFLRGDHVDVDKLESLPRHEPIDHAWTGFARVRERGVYLFVINTPGGLNEPSDFARAGALLTRLNGMALVVRNSFSDTVELFEPPALYSALSVSSGESSTDATIFGLDLIDTVMKFLDTKDRVLRLSWSDGPVVSVDVHAVLITSSSQALLNTARRSARFGTNPAKRRGYEHVGAITDAFVALVPSVLEHRLAPDDVAGLVEETEL